MERLNNLIKLAPVLFVAFLTASPAMAEVEKTQATISLEERLEFVSTLLEKSSATRQIDESGKADAISRRDVARNHYQKAQQAYEAGDKKVADKELSEATTLMFEAVRLAKKDEITETKKKRDYQNRLDSINALMEAHNRVSEEKGKQSDGRELNQIVAEKVKAANSLFKKNKLDDAREVLDEAYIAAKIAINTIRGGDTLVRSLHFETKEDEYLYEIDRNDTHKMLLTILNKDGKKPGKMSQSFIDKAEQLREQAEKEASTGDHEQAIHTLEESTKNLVRALRGSGIYIPG